MGKPLVVLGFRRGSSLIGVDDVHAATLARADGVKVHGNFARESEKELRVEVSIPRYAVGFPHSDYLESLSEFTRRSRPRRVSTLADATGRGCQRRLAEIKAGRLHELSKKTMAQPEVRAPMSFEVGMLIQQYDLLDKQIEVAEPPVDVRAPRRPTFEVPSELNETPWV